MIFVVVALFGVVLVQGEWIRKCRGWMGEAEAEVQRLRLQMGGYPIAAATDLREARRRVDDWSSPQRPL